MASLLPDALLLDLLKDDRVAMRQTALEELVHSQLSHLAGIEALTWDRLADHLEGASAKSIRSDVFRAALTSAAFFQWRTLSTIKTYPWLLCSGDMDAKAWRALFNPKCSHVHRFSNGCHRSTPRAAVWRVSCTTVRSERPLAQHSAWPRTRPGHAVAP